MATLSDIISLTHKHLLQLAELRDDIVITDNEKTGELIRQLLKDGNNLSREVNKSRDVIDLPKVVEDQIIGSIESIRKSASFLQQLGHQQKELFKAFDHIQEALRSSHKPARVEKPSPRQAL